MKNKTVFILIIFICSLSKTVYGSNLICEFTKYNCPSVDYEELVIVENLYHKKFDDKPFTGQVIGRLKGFIKRGKMTGQWSCFDFEGVLKEMANYKNNRREGETKVYHPNGTPLTIEFYEKGLIEKEEYYNYLGYIERKYGFAGKSNLKKWAELIALAREIRCNELP